MVFYRTDCCCLHVPGAVVLAKDSHSGAMGYLLAVQYFLLLDCNTVGLIFLLKILPGRKQSFSPGIVL